MKINNDLLIEAGKTLKNFKTTTLKTKFGATICKINISSEEQAQKIGKEKGDYFTLEKLDANYFLTSEINVFSKTLATLLVSLIKKNMQNYPKKVMIACLGNKNMVCDALATFVMEKLIITHNLKNNFGKQFADLSCIAPNVLGQTGIESCDVVKGVVQLVKPELLIVVDTLCAENYKRIGKSFQMNFGGITPGGGVNNNRKRIDKENLGVDVLTLGVPMVTKAQTLLKLNNCEKFDNALKNLIITTNEIEILNKYCSTIIARAINLAVHRNIDYKTIVDFMN